MYKENELSYLKGKLTAGIDLRSLSGVASMIWYHHKKVLSTDQVLKNIKTSFLKEGAIEGAWVSFEKESVRKFAVRSSVYRGGLSRIEDGETAHYEFLADAHTGTILDVSRRKGAID